MQTFSACSVTLNLVVQVRQDSQADFLKETNKEIKNWSCIIFYSINMQGSVLPARKRLYRSDKKKEKGSISSSSTLYRSPVKMLSSDYQETSSQESQEGRFIVLIIW